MTDAKRVTGRWASERAGTTLPGVDVAEVPGVPVEPVEPVVVIVVLLSQSTKYP